jgi:hypothetical protein
MRQMIAYIKREEWSPYMAGILLGLVAILIAVTATAFRDPAIALGASGAFESILGGLAQWVWPDWVAKNLYFTGLWQEISGVSRENEKSCGSPLARRTVQSQGRYL